MSWNIYIYMITVGIIRAIQIRLALTTECCLLPHKLILAWCVCFVVGKQDFLGNSKVIVSNFCWWSKKTVHRLGIAFLEKVAAGAAWIIYIYSIYIHITLSLTCSFASVHAFARQRGSYGLHLNLPLLPQFHFWPVTFTAERTERMQFWMSCILVYPQDITGLILATHDSVITILSQKGNVSPYSWWPGPVVAFAKRRWAMGNLPRLWATGCA